MLRRDRLYCTASTLLQCEICFISCRGLLQVPSLTRTYSLSLFLSLSLSISFYLYLSPSLSISISLHLFLSLFPGSFFRDLSLSFPNYSSLFPNPSRLFSLCTLWACTRCHPHTRDMDDE